MSIMDDATNVNNLPEDGEYVAGYGNGFFANFSAEQARFGSRAEIEVDVNAQGIGNCLDIEPGDASAAQAPTWIRNRILAGVRKPWLYCDASEWQSVQDALLDARISLNSVYWWIAEYTGVPHLPELNGIVASACQYEGGITARFDQSVVATGIFDPPAPAAHPAYLLPGRYVASGARLTCSTWACEMQTNGDLVVYAAGNRPVWHSNTAGHPDAILVMQTDGNLVVIAPGNRPLWASGTSGRVAACAVFQDDGNLVVLAPGDVPVWDSGS